MQIIELYVNGYIRPLGIDDTQPAFNWKFARETKRGMVQSAYRILVSDDEQALMQGQANMWDSGMRSARHNANIIYEGKPLSSRSRYYWKVQVWDQDGVMTESAASWWEMALLEDSDWQAQWIGMTEDSKVMPLYRRNFEVSKPIQKARVYVSGLGHYEMHLNGKKVENRVLEPGWTNFDKTLLYNSYDVSDFIRAGTPNTIGMMLGNGFFHVPGGRYTKFKDSFGLARCLVQLEITHTDGSVTRVVSDDSWQTSDGPITFSCIYGGEDYDARLEQFGWDSPGFTGDAKLWRQAAVVEPPKGRLRAQKNPPLKVMQTFKPVENGVQDHPDQNGSKLIDLGQNFSGWVRITVQGERGAAIKMIPSELTHEGGIPNQRHSGSPYEWNYTLKGGETEVWAPRFTYYGFRYLQIDGVETDPSAAAENGLPLLVDIVGEMIYPDIQVTGQLETSDTEINRIHEIIDWAILSNTKSIFTDCPHREKLGWLEQVHLMGQAVMYNFDVNNIMAKVIDDIRDAQLDNGMVPTTAPEYVVFQPPWDIFRHSVSWAATYILAPLYMYHKYGNSRILMEHFDGMKSYVDYLVRESKDLIVQDGLGDWYDVGEKGPGFSQITPVPLPETAMFYHVVEKMAEIAAIIGRDAESAAYVELAKRIRKAYQAEFFDAENVRYGNGSQASQAMSLALGLVDEEHRASVLQHLLQDIADHDGHTTTGDVAHRFELMALAEHNRSDIIYNMVKKKDYPSYGYQIEHGATTLTEAWDGPTVGHSQNHFMLGHIEEWFYKGLAGVDYKIDPESGAYAFTFKPYTGSPLTYVTASQELLTGTARIHWEKQAGGGVAVEVEIPVNSTAVVHLPAASADDVRESGHPLADTAGVVRVDVGASGDAAGGSAAGGNAVVGADTAAGGSAVVGADTAAGGNAVVGADTAAIAGGTIAVHIGSGTYRFECKG